MCAPEMLICEVLDRCQYVCRWKYKHVCKLWMWLCKDQCECVSMFMNLSCIVQSKICMLVHKSKDMLVMSRIMWVCEFFCSYASVWGIMQSESLRVYLCVFSFYSYLCTNSWSHVRQLFTFPHLHSHFNLHVKVDGTNGK